MVEEHKDQLFTFIADQKEAEETSTTILMKKEASFTADRLRAANGVDDDIPWRNGVQQSKRNSFISSQVGYSLEYHTDFSSVIQTPKKVVTHPWDMAKTVLKCTSF
ncbi:hypothetical protein KIN20_011260 [Parelaphostrongylus tenuis]|uniref:Uncharacterized protein n=1 Tax=Parelaphostrongylus tenuis TaxID=148309 RepID=A0AAD5MRU5_PARTN|nr:hypothetical protein KIN20_011260 [Parelaphostrongylus tenuis]